MALGLRLAPAAGAAAGRRQRCPSPASAVCSSIRSARRREQDLTLSHHWSGASIAGPLCGGRGRRWQRAAATQRDAQYDQYARRGSYDYPPPPGDYRQQQPPPPPPNGGGGGGGGDGDGMSRFTAALIGGAFIMGMGAGVWFDTEANFEPRNVASTNFLDDKTPSSEVCMANGYSSMVFDQRIFVSLNPFNVYVSQPEVKPGCVLRKSNVGVLEQRKLINNQEVSSCKNRMNTFAYVGDLQKSPEVSCVYHSEEAENQYLKDPRMAVMGDGLQQRPSGGG